MNFALLLTWSRIFAIPVIVLVYFLPFKNAHLVAAIAFALVAITDWLDGFVARNLDQCTKLGAFLDPVADKLLVSISLLMILSQQYMPFLALPAAVIVGRELTISALREWMAEIGKRTSVAVTFVAKLKTVMQLVAIGVLLLYRPHMPLYVLYIGVVLLSISAVLTLWSMIIYLKIAWPDLTLHGE
ncbi:MAG: CDP-diacylglycerol--glycerol-3-phosphate 3-phosphatidyltransferase, partial [Coxiellaceae bacterium]|nr:CDP-diacylglycerol--glycerol-3-phosphate 3-phosphatidyltransferase [Coxiellaceae bacterium]